VDYVGDSECTYRWKRWYWEWLSC